MYCPRCGTQLNDGVSFCSKCGAFVGKQSDGAAYQPIQQAPPVNPYASNVPVQTNNGQQNTNGIGVAGFITSFFFPIVGLVLSIIGMNKSLKGAPHKGLSLAGIIISGLGMLFSIISWIVFYALLMTNPDAIANMLAYFFILPVLFLFFLPFFLAAGA